jgi:hypothetical protein
LRGNPQLLAKTANTPWTFAPKTTLKIGINHNQGTSFARFQKKQKQLGEKLKQYFPYESVQPAVLTQFTRIFIISLQIMYEFTSRSQPPCGVNSGTIRVQWNFPLHLQKFPKTSNGLPIRTVTELEKRKISRKKESTFFTSQDSSPTHNKSIFARLL